MAEIDRRKFLMMSMLSTLAVPLTGCFGKYENMSVDQLISLLNEKLGDGNNDPNLGEDDLEVDEEDFDIDEDELEDENGKVTLAVTYPAGYSPNVFINGWIFGAKCTVEDEFGRVTDMSRQVKWSGSGEFNPSTGSISRPKFDQPPGSKTITVSVDYGGKTYEKSISVNTVSTKDYAALSHKAACPSDSHGCPACPHPVQGPITTGSPNVLINGLPAARMGDTGIHAACCDGNTFQIVEGDSSVLINGRPAAKLGHKTQHCGGVGKIIEASPGDPY